MYISGVNEEWSKDRSLRYSTVHQRRNRRGFRRTDALYAAAQIGTEPVIDDPVDAIGRPQQSK